MKKIKALVVGSLLAAALAACAYGGAAASGEKVVVLRNDAFLFGALRAAYVCKITDTGLSDCQAATAP
ncbi:MAG: hypothetical protein HY903_07195 [Deltaproteobacteria bacterium]|nr:hypothetical protein [Deltaproteobacteria bacterium]